MSRTLAVLQACFSSLYIGILAATKHQVNRWPVGYRFQFPLHRDPRCNRRLLRRDIRLPWFQFPLHRDPRCNQILSNLVGADHGFSSLYIGILAATAGVSDSQLYKQAFQFPLHRDPRCNNGLFNVAYEVACFSSLYIGILAATPVFCLLLGTTLSFQFPLHRDPRCNPKILPP